MDALQPQALPLVNWLFWTALSSGTIGVVSATEILGGTTRGYRLFMAFVVVAFAGVLVLSEINLPVDPAAPARRVLVLGAAVAAGAYLVAAIARLPRSWIGLAAAALGCAALVSVAAGLASAVGTLVAALFGLQLLLATVALGSTMAAMLLGHWYLVTPRLSPTPLRRMMVLLLAGLVLQGVAFAAALLVVPAAAALSGSLAWLTWLRLFAGILLPLVICVLAVLASRAPSLQATTGLLYVALALVMAGSIAGSSIAYLTGVPV